MDLVDENNVLSVRLANSSHALTISVTPDDVFIDSKAYIYEVEDESIASVAEDGMITLLKAGTTTLTAKFRGNQDVTGHNPAAALYTANSYYRKKLMPEGEQSK